MEGSSLNGRISDLPQVVLKEIFENLNTKDKFVCASVCKDWHEMIISNKRLALWNVLTLHLKPMKGRYAKKEHDFHIQMCEKYLTRSYSLVLYVCHCQEQILKKLCHVFANSRHSKQKCVIFRQDFNACCRAKTEVSLSDNVFSQNVSKIVTNFRYLKYLSFGFDCNVNILKEMCGFFSSLKHSPSITILNISSLSCYMYTNLDLSWLCELHELTISFETLRERTLRKWIRSKSLKLENLRIVFMDTMIEEYSMNVRDNTDQKTQLDNFPQSKTWSDLKTTFPSLKIQLVLVAPSSHLENLLRNLPSKIPFEGIIIIFWLNECNPILPFQQWFNQQNCSQLKSVAIHGMERANFYCFSSDLSERWLDYCFNQVIGIENFTITGMFVTVSKLMEFVGKPTLRNLNISRHDLVVDSQVQSNLQVKPNPTQVAKYEKLISEKLNQTFKCDKDIPFQGRYKDFSLLNKSRGILQREEDMQMISI